MTVGVPDPIHSKVKLISAYIDHLAGRAVRASLERLPHGLIAAAKSAERVRCQQWVDDQEPRTTVQRPADANDCHRNQREQKRRPRPAEPVDDRPGRGERDQAGAGQRHEAPRQGRPSLGLPGPEGRQHRYYHIAVGKRRP